MTKILVTLNAFAILAHVLIFNFGEPTQLYWSSSILMGLFFLLCLLFAARFLLFLRTKHREAENAETFEFRRPKIFYNIKNYAKAAREKYRRKERKVRQETKDSA